MASVVNDPGGRRRILFVAPDENRKAIRLGKIDRKSAEAIARHVEALLAAKISAQPVPRETAAWLANIGTKLRNKLAAVELIARSEAKAAETLGAFLQTWLSARKGDYKPASLIAWGQAIDSLTGFLGVDCPLADV